MSAYPIRRPPRRKINLKNCPKIYL